MITQITQLQPKTLKYSTPLKDNNKKNNNPSFKSAGALASQTLNWLNTSPAIGACFVDFFSMVMPRTIVDFSRSADAGMETGFRESSGTFNHALAGIVGLGAGYLVSSAFNKANGVKAHLMFMDGKTIDTFKDFVNHAADGTGYNAEKYWAKFFENLQYLNTTDPKLGEEAWHSLDKGLVENAKAIMLDDGAKEYRLNKSTLAKLSEAITGKTGASTSFRIVKDGVSTGVDGSLRDLTVNANSMFKAVKDKAAHDGSAVVKDLEKFLKGIKNRKLATVAAGLAVPVGIGMSVQPFNRYLTKKRTGSDGFVGVEGREPDHSKGFKISKIVLGLAMGSAMIATILKKPSKLYSNIKEAAPELLSKLQYKGMVPTLEQFKFIYGMTIMSRIFAARDKNEMRESAIKDSLGFANWLILGGFVSKLTARALDKDIINYDKNQYGKGLWNFITKSVEKSHEEILYPALKELNIKSVKDGKQIPFRKLVDAVKQELKKGGQHAEVINKAETAIRQLRYKNIAQMLGYIYSGVVLGWGIPKLNIAITNYVEGKKSSKKNNEAVESVKMKVSQTSADIYPESKTFSAFGAYLN